MEKPSWDLIIIGGGAAGIFAAIRSRQLGIRTLVIESQPRAGSKFLLSGGGRCNITNRLYSAQDFASETPLLVRNVLQALSYEKTKSFFHSLGIELVQEEEGRMFPKNDSAEKTLAVLLRIAREQGVEFRMNSKIQRMSTDHGCFSVSGEGFALNSQTVLLATGGASFPKTGSDGSGYALAQSLGHTLVEISPALTPLLTRSKTWQALSGLSVPAILQLSLEEKLVRETRGPLLFTHHGFSGSAVLNMSRFFIRAEKGTHPKLQADFLPGKSREYFRREMDEQCRAAPKKSLLSFCEHFLPSRLSTALIQTAGLTAEKPLNQLALSERNKLTETLFACPLPISGFLGFETAHVTAGGIPLSEVDTATLSSKIRPGLFFAGEILDADGRSGGFNLQWAWSSAYAAAAGVAKYLRLGSLKGSRIPHGPQL
ncbi:MAG: NAD(P)/FAD-dependent oxidoreductase [Candidatus Omnitrophota bacterium]